MLVITVVINQIYILEKTDKMPKGTKITNITIRVF